MGMGMGGPGAGGRGHGDMMRQHGDGAMGVPDGTGLGMPDAVVMVYGLNPDKMNCDRVFIII